MYLNHLPRAVFHAKLPTGGKQVVGEHFICSKY